MRNFITINRKQGRSTSSVRAKVKWLRHWYAYGGSDDKKTVVKAMQKAGLVSKNTYWHDVSLEHLKALCLKKD